MENKHDDEHISEEDEVIFDGESEDSDTLELYVSEEAELIERSPGVVLKLPTWPASSIVMSTTGNYSLDWEGLNGSTKRYPLGRDLATAYRKVAGILTELGMMPTKAISMTYVIYRFRGNEAVTGMYQATSLEWDQDAIGWTETEALSNLRHAISIKLLGREQHSLPEPVQVIRVGRIKVNAIQPLSE